MWFERVVQASVHIEVLVVALFSRIIIPECRMESDARVQEPLVRLLELVHEVLRPFAAPNVSAQEQDEFVLEPLVQGCHLLGELVLRLLAGP